MYNSRPIIGVIPLYDSRRDSYWIVPGYMKGLEEQGGIPLLLPLTDAAEELDYFLSACDGFLLTGGQDVSPAFYGEEQSPLCGETLPLRDAMERRILFGALEKNRAVLGICRGLQFMNAALGGTLYQDLPTEHPSETGHSMTPPYDREAHSVRILPDTPLHALLGCERLAVNSYHHQAVKRLAGPLRAMAESPDGLTEAAYYPEKPFVWAVQWHPELSYKSDEASRKIFAAFLKAASE